MKKYKITVKRIRFNYNETYKFRLSEYSAFIRFCYWMLINPNYQIIKVEKSA